MDQVVSDAAVVAERQDLEMLRRPWLWPNGQETGRPYVYVKRHVGDDLETGPLCQDITNEAALVIRCHQWHTDGHPVSVLCYSTPEDVIADGWVVD